MNEETRKRLAADPDGLKTYEYLANNIDSIGDDIGPVIDNMVKVDRQGQFVASAARYLHAIDPVKYAPQIETLVAATIDHDREHRYLADLLQSLYGDDYETRAEGLIATDNNFRRIYKRLFPTDLI